ncbi:unnamed protein product [Staurois parvus]|uniref:Uncharacterized protein n=1 Tax=Staurois parvus TaxID=386267 RepID=A0ABN9D0A6_9NEOB|nr:unnamed protein product [Staurois parvus]
MHSPKKKKLYTHQTEHVQLAQEPIRSYLVDTGRRGGSEKTESNVLFTQCRGLTL